VQTVDYGALLQAARYELETALRLRDNLPAPLRERLNGLVLQQAELEAQLGRDAGFLPYLIAAGAVIIPIVAERIYSHYVEAKRISSYAKCVEELKEKYMKVGMSEPDALRKAGEDCKSLLPPAGGLDIWKLALMAGAGIGAIILLKKVI